jgi:hypothetical protein
MIMGLIREPKNVDFTVMDKPWTETELKEFGAFIKARKEQREKKLSRLQCLCLVFPDIPLQT